MYYRFIVAFIFFINLNLNSQNLDSIFLAKQNTLKTIKTATDKIDLLYECGEYFYFKNIDKSEYFFNEALILLKDQNNTMEGKILWKLGFIERNKGNLGTSLRYFNKAKKIFKETKDYKNFASIHFDIGYLYRYKNEEAKELEFYKKGLKLNKELDQEITGKSYLHFGNYYTRQKKLDSSIYCYNKALEIFKTLKKDNRIYNVYNNMSNTYYKQGRYKKAIDTRILILRYAKAENKKLLISVNYHNIGAAYTKLNKHNIASTYLDSAISVAKKDRFKLRLAKSYKSKALLNHYKLKKYDVAFETYRLHKIYSDSIFKSQQSNKIKEVELENKLKIEKKNLQLSNQQQAYEKKLYLIFFIIFLLSSIPIAVLLYKDSINKSKITESNLEKEKIKKQVLLQKIYKSETETKNLIADNSMRLEFLKQISTQLKEQKKLIDPNEMKAYIKDLSFKVQQQITTESKLTLLNNKINSINHNFENKLVLKSNNLTKSERELCALLRLNLSIKEIASIRNSSTDAIKATRYRIRKKMNIPKNTKLESFIQNL